MNKVFLIGRLTKDPEIRLTSTGKKVASFAIAVNEGKDSNGQDLVQYFNMSAWEKLADILEQYVKKGSKVAVIGRLQNRSWDKPDGTKGYATDVSVKELEILSSRSETSEYSAPNNSESAPNSQDEEAAGSDKKAKSKKEPEAELPEIDVDSINVQMPF